MGDKTFSEADGIACRLSQLAKADVCLLALPFRTFIRRISCGCWNFVRACNQVGAAPDLSTIWTRRAFALRQGIEPNPALQSAWNTHGADSFTFEILEEIDLDELTYGREPALKERIAHWRDALGATAI